MPYVFCVCISVCICVCVNLGVIQFLTNTCYSYHELVFHSFSGVPLIHRTPTYVRNQYNFSDY